MQRKGVGLFHAGNHSTAHKKIVWVWRDIGANSTHGTVYLGDKKLGLDTYTQYSASYVPDLLTIKTEGKPDIHEAKKWSGFVQRSTRKPACTQFTGHTHLTGNTEERAKHRVLGARQRSVQAAGVFDHTTGEGFVARHDGDYHDAINHRKANVKLVLHGALGGMSVFTSKILHRAARDAKKNGCDATNYGECRAAATFVPHYAQKLSWAAIQGTALTFAAQLAKQCRDRLRRQA